MKTHISKISKLIYIPHVRLEIAQKLTSDRLLLISTRFFWDLFAQPTVVHQQGQEGKEKEWRCNMTCDHLMSLFLLQNLSFFLAWRLCFDGVWKGMYPLNWLWQRMNPPKMLNYTSNSGFSGQKTRKKKKIGKLTNFKATSKCFIPVGTL